MYSCRSKTTARACLSNWLDRFFLGESVRIGQVGCPMLRSARERETMSLNPTDREPREK
jgi:hypothetical protein